MKFCGHDAISGRAGITAYPLLQAALQPSLTQSGSRQKPLVLYYNHAVFARPIKANVLPASRTGMHVPIIFVFAVLNFAFFIRHILHAGYEGFMKNTPYCQKKTFFVLLISLDIYQN